MGKSKILLIDMYGVIIQESKGYFIPYTLQRFEAAEHDRIKRIIRDEQCFTKTQRGELSNEEFLTDYHRINQYFKDKIVSGEVHMRKPDKEMFTYALKRLGCNSEQCIFVDNSVSNLLVAEELGIQTILFNCDGVEYDGNVVNDFEALGKMLDCMQDGW